MLVPLAERGFEMTGIDLCDSRRQRCRDALRKLGVSASVRHSAMLLQDEAILHFLRRLHGALRPGGLLLLDIWNMLAQGEILDRPMVSSETRLGNEVTFQEVHHLDSLRGRMHIHMHATVSGGNGGKQEIDHEEVLRVVTPAEMRMLLQTARFENVAAYPRHEQANEPPDNPEGLWFAAR